MRMLLIVAVGLGLAGCTTITPENFQSQVAATCANTKPIMDGLEVVYDAGELNAANERRFEAARQTYDQVCAPGAVVDWASAAVAIATAYVIVVKINREEQE